MYQPSLDPNLEVTPRPVKLFRMSDEYELEMSDLNEFDWELYKYCSLYPEPDPFQSHHTLDSLPDQIIGVICGNLSTRELLTLTLVSQHFHYLATPRLYKKIAVLGGNHDVQNYNTWAKSASNIFSYTPVKYERVEKLVKTIQADVTRADLILSIHIRKGLQGPEIKALLSLTHVNELYVGDCHILNSYSSCHLQILQCPLAQAFGNLTNIVDLQIVDAGSRCFSDHFSYLARNLIQSGGFRTLRSLSFWGSSVEVRGSSIAHKPGWAYFFDTLEIAWITLNLKSLHIHGPFKLLGVLSLVQTIDIRQLKSLAISFFAWHKTSAQEQFEAVNFLLATASSLEDLAMKYQNHHGLVMQLLNGEWMLDKLKTLNIVNANGSQNKKILLRNIILSTQHNLRRLSLNEVFTETEKTTEVANFLHECLHYHSSTTRLMGIFAPHAIKFDRLTPVGSSDNARRILFNLRLISQFLKQDLIYQNARKLMPELSEYVVEGIRTDPQRQRIVLDGVFICSR